MDARKVYPGMDEDSFYGPSNYVPIFEALGQVLLMKSENDYQGSSWVLLKLGNLYATYTFGWGSCSGCDALQGCDNYQELQKLLDSIESEVLQGFTSAQELLKKFLFKDWELEWDGRSDEAKQYRVEAVQILEDAVATEYSIVEFP